jgi:hypothetical protein
VIPCIRFLKVSTADFPGARTRASARAYVLITGDPQLTQALHPDDAVLEANEVTTTSFGDYTARLFGLPESSALFAAVLIGIL